MRQHIGFAMRTGLAFVLLLALTGISANAGKGGNGGSHGGKPGGGGGSQDTTPPGAVTNLSVGEVGIATVALTWTASADDGYDATTGAPASYLVRLRSSGPFTPDNWDDENGHISAGTTPVTNSPWPDPGDTVHYTVYSLAPESHYWIGVRARDAAGNLSGITEVQADTRATPATAWATTDIDSCPSADLVFLWVAGFDFDSSGHPAILYEKNCAPETPSSPLFMARFGENGWVSEPLTSGSNVLESRDPSFEDLALDPVTQQLRLAHVESNGGLTLYTYDGTAWSGETVEKSKAGTLSLAYCGGVPTIAYKRGAAIRVAQREGNHWNTTEFGLPRSQNTQFISLDLACDDLGNPAVAFGQDRNGDASQEIVRVALWRNGGWQIETVAEAGPGGNIGVDTLVWDLDRGDFTLSYGHNDTPSWDADADKVGVCDRTAGVWSCVDLDTSGGLFARVGGLFIDGDGTASLFYATDWSALWLVQRPPNSTWNGPEDAEYVGYVNAFFGVASSPGTGPAVALDSGGMEDRLPPTIQYATPLPSP